ncbi:hypothetical protein [Tsukamurella soli]|uniref:hypothetical protein n=1 Tax=Tsukamurella soli TaxID=644556 RepID=UPI003611628B
MSALTIGTLAVSACSTAGGTQAGPSGSSPAVVYAKQQIDQAKAIPQFTLNAPPFDMSKIRGKTIFNIPTSSVVAYVAAVDAQAKSVAEKYGARWIEYNNQGSPTEYAAGIDEAISQKADLIILAQTIDAKLALHR